MHDKQILIIYLYSDTYKKAFRNSAKISCIFSVLFFLLSELRKIWCGFLENLFFYDILAVGNRYKGRKMRRRVFTLAELIVIISIVVVIVSFFYVGYRVTIEKAAAKVCKQNQKVIYEALKIYALENYRLPGSLGEVPGEYYQKAYVKLLNLEKNPLWIKLAYFLVDLKREGLIRKVFAFGNSLLDEGLIEKRVLDCPLDSTPYSQGGISYGLNQALVNASEEEFKNFTGLVIGDCENSTFTSPLSDLAFRHKKNIIENAAVVTLKGGETAEIKEVATSELSNIISCISNCPSEVHPGYLTCFDYCKIGKGLNGSALLDCVKNCHQAVAQCEINCLFK